MEEENYTEEYFEFVSIIGKMTNDIANLNNKIINLEKEKRDLIAAHRNFEEVYKGQQGIIDQYKEIIENQEDLIKQYQYENQRMRELLEEYGIPIYRLILNNK